MHSGPHVRPLRTESGSLPGEDGGGGSYTRSDHERPGRVQFRTGGSTHPVHRTVPTTVPEVCRCRRLYGVHESRDDGDPGCVPSRCTCAVPLHDDVTLPTSSLPMSHFCLLGGVVATGAVSGVDGLLGPRGRSSTSVSGEVPLVGRGGDDGGRRATGRTHRVVPDPARRPTPPQGPED